MGRITLFIKMEELKRKLSKSFKMKIKLFSIVIGLFVLSACSGKRFMTKNPAPDEEMYSMNKEEVSLVFFETENASDLQEHLKIYKRFAEAFADGEDVHVLSISQNTVIEFENYGFYYFYNNGAKFKSGMILSNGVDEPIIETNPKNYIKRYEAYFNVLFNDKVYYGQKRKAEIEERRKKSEQLLNERMKVDQHYATLLINNANAPFYPKKSGIGPCLTGKVMIKLFEDSAKTKKGAVELETVYDKNGLIKRTTTLINGKLFSEELYHRNTFNLIDSIVNIDNKGTRSKSVFKYGKNHYTVVSVDATGAMISNVFHLNDKFQCVKKETLNGSGDVVTITLISYDGKGRVVEEINASQQLVYEYKSPEDDFYSVLRSYDKNHELLNENIRTNENGKEIFVVRNKDGLVSKTISVNNPKGCTMTVYNYNMQNQISEVYEYYYEN